MIRNFFVFAVIVFVVWLFVRPPVPMPHSLTVPEGASIDEVAALLKDQRALASPSTFSLFSRMFGGVKFGSYIFERPVNALELAWRLSRGGNAPLTRITIPEGASAREIGEILAGSLEGFDTAGFMKLALPEEGYLFPDTYFFAPGVPARDVVTAMRRTYDEKTVELKPTREQIIMASILEKEARLFETRATIAGILWKRLERGMALQVDAVFGYIFGTSTFSPTFDQLKVVSPYNTYTNTGLPPGPIGNPGLEAIRAAQNPTKTPYWYYLTGADGTMHYAKTFDEHVANRKYLR